MILTCYLNPISFLFMAILSFFSFFLLFLLFFDHFLQTIHENLLIHEVNSLSEWLFLLRLERSYYYYLAKVDEDLVVWTITFLHWNLCFSFCYIFSDQMMLVCLDFLLLFFSLLGFQILHSDRIFRYFSYCFQRSLRRPCFCSFFFGYFILFGQFFNLWYLFCLLLFKLLYFTFFILLAHFFYNYLFLHHLLKFYMHFNSYLSIIINIVIKRFYQIYFFISITNLSYVHL